MSSQTFGQLIAETRKKAGLSQKELAAKIKKEDGGPISPQYLNDIERDRRNPPSEEMLSQFAKLLDLDMEVLLFHVRKLPSDIAANTANSEKIIEAYKAFRKALK